MERSSSAVPKNMPESYIQRSVVYEHTSRPTNHVARIQANNTPSSAFIERTPQPLYSTWNMELCGCFESPKICCVTFFCEEITLCSVGWYSKQLAIWFAIFVVFLILLGSVVGRQVVMITLVNKS
ncbi:uncharacterized protein LOC142340728 [Convolutriloba macropyga]|uniref:uncharacterized protein LOC142340728 n=1 Tax=Convolutriloba macropyga TaxID=536237 RepID=UPI003F528BEB